MFSVGEFSKIAQVSGRLLRYYDQIGLLKPAHIDHNSGYRYYRANQLPQLNRILALKELGLSLEQIARLLNENISSEDILEMLTIKKAQLTQTLTTELARLRYVQARIEQINQKGQMKDYEIVLKSIPDHKLLAWRELVPTLAEAWQLIGEIQTVVAKNLKHKALGYFTVVTHTDMFETENMDLELGFLVNTKADLHLPLSHQRVLTVRELAGNATMLTGVRTGEFETGHLSYTALGIWMEANGYQFAGPSREVFIQPAPPPNQAERVVEIQIPVRKIAAANQL
jgi:DNA-binding transcriptional MerR regulator